MNFNWNFATNSNPLQEEPIEGHVCQKCWVKVSVFHDFYSHIECVHRSNESVFVESIVDMKHNAETYSDDWFEDFPPESQSIDAEPAPDRKQKREVPRANANTQKRKRGRPRKDESKTNKLEDCGPE